MKRSGKLVDPSTLANKRMSVDNSHSPRPNGANAATQMMMSRNIEPMNGGVTVGSTVLPSFPKKDSTRPILMQSSVLAPSIDDKQSVPFDLQSINSPSAANVAGAFTKTSYLNKPVCLQTSSSFQPSETS